jgi:hypothetical protein
MRTKPYSKKGIKKVPCKRCGKPSTQQWNICADDNQFRGVCDKCDIALNLLVLKFFKFPDVKQKINKYKQKFL